MKKLLLVLTLLALPFFSAAQIVWTPLQNKSTAGALTMKASVKSVQSTMQFPDTDGNLTTYKVRELKVMDDKLAAQFPDIKVYEGKNANKVIRFTVTPLGLSVTGDSLYIDKVGEETYSVHKKTAKPAVDYCFTPEPKKKPETVSVNNKTLSSSSYIKEFRLAVSVTSEYTVYFGGTKALALSAVVNTISRVNFVFERDFGVRLILIPETIDLIFVGADPYSQYYNYKTELPPTVRRIAPGKYDLAHLFATSTDQGNALSVGNVCKPDCDGAYSSRSNPVGDDFDIDYVAHEMGHQFGASHTFTFRTDSYVAQNETGSGYFIMGYSGLGGTTYDINPHSKPWMGAKSIEQVKSYIQNYGSCTVNRNLVSSPEVDAGLDYTIPRNTPFMLTGTANAITYNWEEIDLGAPSTSIPMNNTTASGPRFQPFEPSTSKIRYCPALETVLAGKLGTKWEWVYVKGQLSRWRFVARGVVPNWDDVTLTVDPIATDFKITSFNTPASVLAGSTQTLTWNVGGTNANGVKALTVDVLWATDRKNYLKLLTVPNNGSCSFSVPPSVGNSNRIMLRGSNNIFFDINDADIAVTSPLPVKPENVAATSITTTSLVLSWAGTSSNYQIYKDGVLFGVSSVNSFAVSGLSLNTVYRFTVKADLMSDVLSITTLNRSTGDVVQPTIPQTLTAVASATSIRLNWLPSTDNTGILNYSVYVNGVFKASTTSPTYNITGLSRATIYKLSVMAKDISENRSNESEIISVKTL